MSKVTETRQQKGIYVRKTLGLAVLGAAMTLAAGNAAAAGGSFTGEAQGMGPVSVPTFWLIEKIFLCYR